MDNYMLWLGFAVLVGGFAGWLGGAIHGFQQGVGFCLRDFEQRMDRVDRFMNGELRAVLKRAEQKAAEQTTRRAA